MAKEIKKITTKEFRVAFPNLFEPTGFPGSSTKKYNLTALFPKDMDISELKKLAEDTAKEAWPDGIPAGVRSPFQDGDEKPELDGYPGHIYVSMKNASKPGVVDHNVQEIIDPSQIYGGCIGRATVTCFAYGGGAPIQSSMPPGVSISLQNFQKLRDGDPFSGRSKPEDDFEPVAQPEGQDGADPFAAGTDEVKEGGSVF